MQEDNVEGTSNKSSSAVGISGAILVAGAIIAAAIYLRPGVGSVATNNQPPVQPEAPAIGNFRTIDASDHMRGNTNAKITILEYSDLECPYCKDFHITMQRLLNEYPDDIRWVYRQLPIEKLHSNAPKQAEATECAGEQGKFWELTDKIFAVTPSNNRLPMADLPKLALEAGVPNIAQWQSCFDSGKYTDHIAIDIADAQAAGAGGTPYSLVLGPNNEKIPINGALPYETVKAIVDQVLK